MGEDAHGEWPGKGVGAVCSGQSRGGMNSSTFNVERTHTKTGPPQNFSIYIPANCKSKLVLFWSVGAFHFFFLLIKYGTGINYSLFGTSVCNFRVYLRPLP